MALVAGDLLQGRYRVGAPLGRGGMGAVLEVREEPGGQELVVKQLRLDAPELLEAFRHELALLSRVNEPCLLRVIDFGSERLRGELHHYYIAERVMGASLAERLGSRRAFDALQAVVDALRGLFALHEQGICHGDFTPGNILVDERGRGVLIDLSCARPFGPVRALSGTDGYVAPELLRGHAADARADLYAVGRTLETICAHGGQRPAPAVERLIERLLREDPEARPVDCAEVLETLGERPPRSRQRVHAARLVGRDAELSSFDVWLSAIAQGRRGPRVLSVHGEPGMGSSRLLRELSFRAQLHVSVLRGGAERGLGRLMAVALGLEAALSSRRALLASAAALSERPEPLVLVIEDLDRLPSEQRELVLAIARTLPPRGNLGLVVSSREAVVGEEIRELRCGPLDEPALREWLGPLFTDKRRRELLSASEGRPKRLVRLLRALDHAGSRNDAPADAQLLSGLAASARAALAELFVLDEAIALGDPRFEAGTLDALLAEQLLERDGELLSISEPCIQALRSGALTAAEVRDAHLKAASALSRASESDAVMSARVIAHLVRGGELTRAESVFRESLELLRSGTRRVASVISPLLGASEHPGILFDTGVLALDLGEPRLALRAAVLALRRGGAKDRAVHLASDALVRLGRAPRGERLLEALLVAHPDAQSPGERAETLLRLGRARLQRGDYQGSLARAEAGLLLGAGGSTAGLLSEVEGLASLYAGDTARAEQSLQLALALLGDGARPRDRARIQSHRATVAFRRGQIDRALSDYSAAVTLAEEHDHDDLIATGLLNLGTAQQQAGLWGQALQNYERGATLASALGRVSTQLTLEFNRANLFAEIGVFERAEETLARLERHAERAGSSHFASSIALVRAEIALAQGRNDAAETLLEGARAALEATAQPRELFEVRLRLVDVALARDEPTEAERRIEALAQTAPAAADDLALGLLQARARVDAALGRSRALAAFEEARARAERGGLAALEATLRAELARALRRLGDAEQARKHAERARRAWDRLAADLPRALGTPFWQHPRRADLLEQSRPIAVAAAEATRSDGEAYRRLLSLNRRLNSSLSLDRVLEYAVQAAVDLTEAERGFLLLSEPERATLEVVVARSTDPAVPEGEGPSQSIVRRTLEREEAILTTDAQGDPRFAGQGSVHALRLKSVLSVPVLSPSGTLGVLYVDCRVQRGRFSESERDLLAAFADQLAIAIGNARLHAELERQRSELAKQKHAVEQLSRGQAREIERLKREVEAQRESLHLRYDYSRIVGRGPAMRAVLERLDRVIDSEASVLIRGESGTGKELVARAIHWNGPRKAGPFLGINCAALPEALLESELFGHVRGAFTGAERDKPGLMQAASSGTLFLDEIGELSPATQAKLLRALQEREVRPLGSEKSVPLDVRLVAATHRDLERAMADGKFREDLYYRIAVVTVALPPLRERPEDLAALSSKILERLAKDAGKKAPTLGQDALRLLSAHPFPGNVRELENVLTRAFVLAPGNKIRAEDLELGARRPAAPSARSRRDFEADERERILSALRGSRWNVSVVARTLGIPRNTLYRKLTRYGIARAPEGA